MRDSNTFADIIKTSNVDPSSIFLCSFNISSLFTNVPLAETIRICTDALYCSEHFLAPFPRKIVVELMEMATSFAEFSFNDIKHRQIDNVAGDHTLNQSLPIFLLATMNLNFFRLLLSRRCITTIWMNLCSSQQRR